MLVHHIRPPAISGEERERRAFIEVLVQRHAKRTGLPIEAARRHVEQIAVSARRAATVEPGREPLENARMQFALRLQQNGAE